MEQFLFKVFSGFHLVKSRLLVTGYWLLVTVNIIIVDCGFWPSFIQVIDMECMHVYAVIR